MAKKQTGTGSRSQSASKKEGAKAELGEAGKVGYYMLEVKVEDNMLKEFHAAVENFIRTEGAKKNGKRRVKCWQVYDWQVNPLNNGQSTFMIVWIEGRPSEEEVKFNFNVPDKIDPLFHRVEQTGKVRFIGWKQIHPRPETEKLAQ